MLVRMGAMNWALRAALCEAPTDSIVIHPEGCRPVLEQGKRKRFTKMKQEEIRITDQAPLMCTLSESELSTRSVEVSELFKGVQQVEELADGYALSFPGSDTWANNLVQAVILNKHNLLD